jgi:pyruvate ferredoxin oxidoreductase gamma subunit
LQQGFLYGIEWVKSLSSAGQGGQAVFEVRIHGRGGQGVVTAAEMLSLAAFREGRHAQAFPSFGSERMGAPVMAFCRIDDRPIRLREPVLTPDALIIQDATLLHQVNLFEGLTRDGFVLLNSAREPHEMGLDEMVAGHHPERWCTVGASELAMKHVGRPLPNAALLGGLAALTRVVSLESIEAAIREKFSGAVAEKNCAAAAGAYGLVLEEMETLHA